MDSTTSPIIGLVNNAALLLSLGVLYDVVGRPRGAKRTIQQAAVGVILGAIGIAVMLNPWRFTPGVVFDTRSVLLSVSGLFFGALPTLLATLMTGAFRLYIGGTGTWTGVAVSVTSGAIGVAWRHLRRRQLEDRPVAELYAMGLVVHIAMLLWMFSLPWPLTLEVLSKISLPVMAIYPVVTALLGWLMVNRRARYWVEEALRESEQFLRQVIDTSPNCIFVKNWNGEYVLVNETIAKLYDTSKEDMIGKTDPELAGSGRLSHKEAETFLANDRDVISKQQPKFILEEPLTKADGTIKWFQTVKVPLTSSLVPTRMLGVAVDITERKQAEEQMERVLRRQAVVNQLALALGAASDLDTVYRTAYECVLDMMDCVAFIVSSYDRETDLIHAGYVVTRGTVRDTAGFPPIPLEKEEYGTQSRVIRTGEPLYVPDHQRAMEATETKYKIDAEGKVTPGAPPEEEGDSTRSALYVPMKIKGQTVGVMQVQSNRLDGYDEEDRSLLAALANVTAVAVLNTRLFKSLRQSNQELEAQRANLEELVAQRTADLNEQIGETEQLNRALANLLEDIQVANRGLEQTTQQLEQANEELGAFSYSVSHDLRAPLRAIDGFSRILEDEYAPELAPEAQRYLDLVRSNAQQMGQLIDDLLAFSRLSRRSLDRQSVSPADLAHQVLEELAHEYEGRRVEISVGELPECQADPSLLKQVYVNLLSNALKYTRERESAHIEVGSQPLASGETAYFVKDDGVGFDMRYADKLFGVFQRFHRAEDYEGTGVGLAIVQRIIRRHGGRIWAEAEVDKGATFYFTI